MPWLSLQGRAKIGAGGEEETARRDRSGSGDRNVGSKGSDQVGKVERFLQRFPRDQLVGIGGVSHMMGGRKIGQKAGWSNQGPFIE